MYLIAAILPALAHAVTLALIAVLALWILGSPLLRWGGALTVALGLMTALGHPVGLLITAPGAAAWAAGHWLYALRHHTYKSPLARRLFTQLLPARLDPTRRWAIPTTTTTPDE
jgi:hypothetical protein